ncbi:UNVERIFIED_ORG: tail fiber-like protein [Citrobacter freundii]
MSVLISGALIDGAGIPMSGCHIILKSRVNTSEVVMLTVADVVTGNNGEYSFEAQVGKYCVYLKQDWRDEYCVGDIAVYVDSKPGTLNDFLTALDEGDLKPDVVARFEAMVVQAQQSAEAAAGSEQLAGQHAEEAEQAKERTEALASDVQKNAGAVAEGKHRVEQLASETAKVAEQVKQDAAAAEKSAADAEQARDDIDTVLAATLKTANNLSEIAAEGTEAQRVSRDNLGLKSAATMDPQADIRDRTEGRLAIPGMYGFGCKFFYTDRITFNTADEFLTWARTATPGRYNVYGADKVIPNTLFEGVVEIIWPPALASNYTPVYTVKAIIFYGVNGDVYYNRYWTGGNGYFIGWESLKFGAKNVADTLNSFGGMSNGYSYPDIGGLVFAAYCGSSDADSARKIWRGSGVSGSRLAVVSITAAHNPTGSYASTPQVIVAPLNLCPMAGTFVALSGSPLTSGGNTSAMIGLFVRIM